MRCIGKGRASYGNRSLRLAIRESVLLREVRRMGDNVVWRGGIGGRGVAGVAVWCGREYGDGTTIYNSTLQSSAILQCLTHACAPHTLCWVGCALPLRDGARALYRGRAIAW